MLKSSSNWSLHLIRRHPSQIEGVYVTFFCTKSDGPGCTYYIHIALNKKKEMEFNEGNLVKPYFFENFDTHFE